MGTYNYDQQIYNLSQAANISFSKSLADLQGYLTNTMNGLLTNPAAQELISEWDTIWGPYTWCDYATKENRKSASATPYYSNNTMYLADNAATKQYVLALAGTNFTCLN